MGGGGSFNIFLGLGQQDDIFFSIFNIFTLVLSPELGIR
jgi:hypothetical protein